MSLFGKPAGAGSIFGNNFGSFGSNANTQQQQQQQPGLGLFSQSNANNNQQQQQQQQNSLGQSFFSQPQQQNNPAGSLNYQPGFGSANYGMSHLPIHDDTMIIKRMENLAAKWNAHSPESAFKHYFYNKVPEEQAPYYAPGPADNSKEWDEALQNKPGPGMIPSLASGFEALAQRLKTQRAVIAIFNQKLHEINECLDAILSKHDLDWSVKMIEARRKHDALRRRTLVLARKAQVLRNRGYALSADEDELRIKLENMERTVQDPAVNARLDELWSRLIFLREQAQVLKDELSKKGLGEEQALDSDVEVKIKKIVEDYEKQLQHLKKECELIKKDYTEWVKDHPNFKEQV